MTNIETRFRDLYAAFNTRDIERVLASLASNVNWPNGMTGERVLGRAAVREYWTKQWSVIDPRVDPIVIRRDDLGHVIVDVHQHVRDLNGEVLVDQHARHVYTLDGDSIVRMDIEAVGA